MKAIRAEVLFFIFLPLMIIMGHEVIVVIMKRLITVPRTALKSKFFVYRRQWFFHSSNFLKRAEGQIVELLIYSHVESFI